MLPAVREAMRTVGIEDVRITTAPGEELRLARAAAQEGAETIVAVGGDGTWGNVARGILDSGRDVRLALVAAGTGNDFGHSLGLPVADPRAMAVIAAGTGSLRVDMGRIDGTPFLNVAGVGIEADVLAASQSVRLLRGPAVYLATAIPKLRSYQPVQCRVSANGASSSKPVAYLAIVVSNGPRFGGGFRIAPGASVSDGLLDLVTVRDAAIGRRARIFVRARLGTHLGQPEVARKQLNEGVLLFDEAPLMDIDGELRLASSPLVEIECLRGAIRMAVPEGTGPITADANGATG